MLARLTESIGNSALTGIHRRAGFVYATALTYVLAAGLYFVGFARIEGEAIRWGMFAIAGGALLVLAARLTPGGWPYRVIVWALLAIGVFANYVAIAVWLSLKPGTEYVIGYLGRTTPWYAWPHVAILVLSALAALQVARNPRLPRRIEEADGPRAAATLRTSAWLRHATAVSVVGTGFWLGWLALEACCGGNVWLGLLGAATVLVGLGLSLAAS